MDEKKIDDNTEKKDSHFEDEIEIPPAIRRRRKENSYRSVNSSQTFDIVVIAVALLVGFFMVRSNGCANGVNNLSKFFVSDKNARLDAGDADIPDIEVKTPPRKN